MDFSQETFLTTLLFNNGASKVGNHRDPPSIMPALIAGPGMSHKGPHGWSPGGVGGRVYLADGLVDLSYGPRDVVLLDGNFAHGITSLRALPGQGGQKRAPELERFSLILFSRMFKSMGPKRI